MRLIDGEQLPAPTQRNQASNLESMLPLLLFGGLIFGGILRSMFGEFLVVRSRAVRLVLSLGYWVAV